MNGTRILLLCSNHFALQTMQELAFFQQLAAVVIPSHCDEWIEHASLVLQSTQVPIISVDKVHFAEQLNEAFKTYQANLGLIVSFSFKLPASIIQIPVLGFFNVHPAPLPAYRGADPVFYQIKNQESRSGVSIHVVDTGWDTGPLVMRELIPLLPSDTYGLLSIKLSLLAARLVQNLVKLIGFGLPLPLRAQDSSKASYHARQGAREVSILWDHMSALQVIALINACNPWNKGASTRFGNQIIRFLEARVSAQPHKAEPGSVIKFDQSFILVACKDQQTMEVSVVSTDAGIFSAARLSEIGIVPGMKFESI